MERNNVTSEMAKTDFSCIAPANALTFALDAAPALPILICVLAIPTSLLTTLANLLVIISIWRTPSLHSPSNILLVGLAFSDLGVGSVTLPASIIANVAKIRQEETLFCQTFIATLITGNGLCAVSLLILTAISLDRYIAIHYHLRYREIVTVKRTLTVLTIACLHGGACTLSCLFKLSVGFYFSFLLGCMCLVVVIFVSGSIYRVVRRHREVITAQMQVQIGRLEKGPIILPQLKRSFVNMQILCWALLVCYLPIFISLGSIRTSGNSPSKQSALDISGFCLQLNSTINPFLYCWRYQHIRAALRKLVRDSSCKESTN